MDQHTQPMTIEPVVKVRGIAVITIFVSDLDRAIGFYKEMLGLEEAEQMLSPGHTLRVGEQMIYFVADRDAADREPEPRPEISVCFAVPSVRDAFEKLRDAGVEILADYDEASEYFASFHCADPDGNMLMFWGRP